jgi:hypothetical protein
MCNACLAYLYTYEIGRGMQQVHTKFPTLFSATEDLMVYDTHTVCSHDLN